MSCYDDALQGAVINLFVEFVKPKNVLHVFQSHTFLKKVEIECVEKRYDAVGDTLAAKLLFDKLVKKKAWFSKLQTVLHDQNVKLQHIADIMTYEEDRIRQYFRKSADSNRANGLTRAAYSDSGATLSSLYIEYNSSLENAIRGLFTFMMNPSAAVHVFQKYSDKVLTQIDIDNVKAKVNTNGNHEGNTLLFSRLVLYGNWFDVLLEVLNDSEVNLPDVAKEMKAHTRKAHEDYESKLAQIQHLYNMKENVQLADNRMVTDNPYCVPTRNESRGRPLQEDNSLDELESDCAEMRPEAKRFARSYQNKENTVSDGGGDGRDHAPRGGSSEDGNATTSKTALMSAAAAGNFELLLTLINEGSDVDEADSSGRTALMYAVCKSRVECVRLLISNGCDVNQRDINGCTALMISADKGFTECMRCLIEGKSNVDNSNNEGATALMVAAKKGRVDCVRLLIENCCDVNKCHNDGRTALMFAAFEGHSECVNLLISSGCDVNKSNNKKTTALMYAAQNHHEDCIRLLINGCAEINLANHEGNTAVMYAVSHKKTECLQLLVDSGADVNIANNLGDSPLKFAEENQCRRCVKVLRAANGGR